MTKLFFADLCAGIGGFRLGLEAAGWECVYSCEADKECERTYQKNFGHPYNSHNVFDIPLDGLTGIDVVTCGFPCQPFSVAGKQLGLNDPRGSVLLQLLNIIDKSNPRIVILENVANFASHNNGASLRLVVEALSNMDYDVHFDILDSAYFGVPQHRRRIYIVAFKRALGALLFTLTKKRTNPVPFKEIIAKGDYSIAISGRWHEYIDLYTGGKALENMSFPVPKTRKELERINPGTVLKNCVLQIRSSGIRACSVDAPLPTFAVSHSGGGAMIPVYTGERRHLSVKEITALMGFPITYDFPVARTHAIKQLSNAVCPPVAESIAQDIANLLKAGKGETRLCN